MNKFSRLFFADKDGKVSSTLVIRFFWHVATLLGWIWYGVFRDAGLEWLAFAAVMAGVEGFSYNWRRGQDRKFDMAKVGIPADPPLDP